MATSTPIFEMREVGTMWSITGTGPSATNVTAALKHVFSDKKAKACATRRIFHFWELYSCNLWPIPWFEMQNPKQDRTEIVPTLTVTFSKDCLCMRFSRAKKSDSDQMQTFYEWISKPLFLELILGVDAQSTHCAVVEHTDVPWGTSITKRILPTCAQKGFFITAALVANTQASLPLLPRSTTRTSESEIKAKQGYVILLEQAIATQLSKNQKVKDKLTVLVSILSPLIDTRQSLDKVSHLSMSVQVKWLNLETGFTRSEIDSWLSSSCIQQAFLSLHSSPSPLTGPEHE